MSTKKKDGFVVAEGFSGRGMTAVINEEHGERNLVCVSGGIRKNLPVLG